MRNRYQAGHRDADAAESALDLDKVSALDTLLDHSMTRSLACSLRDINRPLFNAIKALNRLRNRVVHQGVIVDRGEVESAIASSIKLRDWLQHELPSHTSPTGGPGAPAL